MLFLAMISRGESQQRGRQSRRHPCTKPVIITYCATIWLGGGYQAKQAILLPASVFFSTYAVGLGMPRNSPAWRTTDPCQLRCHDNSLRCLANFLPNLPQNGEENKDHAPARPTKPVDMQFATSSTLAVGDNFLKTNFSLTLALSRGWTTIFSKSCL